MQTQKRSPGLKAASETILGLVLLLLAMAAVSGGFIGLAGTSVSLAYSLLVIIPLLLVIFLAARKNRAETARAVVVATVPERTASIN